MAPDENMADGNVGISNLRKNQELRTYVRIDVCSGLIASALPRNAVTMKRNSRSSAIRSQGPSMNVQVVLMFTPSESGALGKSGAPF